MAPQVVTPRRVRGLCIGLAALASVLLCAPAVAGAADWQVTTAPATVWRDISFAGADNGWAVAQDWYISHTADGGTTWTKQDSGIDPSTGGFEAGLRAVDFVSATTGWACGNDLTVIRTTNGGATWTVQPVDPTAFIKPRLDDIDFADALHGCAVQRSASTARIYTTANGGDIWTPRTPPGAVAGYPCAVTLVDASHGWIVDYYGGIAVTSDGGATWTAQRPSSLSSTPLNDVCFTADARHGWAVGNGGVILATTDGGANWNAQTSNTTQNLQSVDFADASHGWAVGLGGTCVATSDGGVTWTAQNGGLGAESMVAVDAVSAGNVFAAGGHIFRLIAGDATRPVPKALANATVKKGKKATLKYRVDDNAATCAVTIVVKKGKAVKKTLVIKSARTNKALVKTFKCTLKKGSYTWSVSATDPSGNACAKASTKKLTVK